MPHSTDPEIAWINDLETKRWNSAISRSATERHMNFDQRCAAHARRRQRESAITYTVIGVVVALIVVFLLSTSAN